jgi:hypothetical protein
VAYLIALKAAARRNRHSTGNLPSEVPMPDPPTPYWERAELKAVIDAELAGLSDRFRSVVALCLIEGRTNSEAAAMLGVPVGTVDSRLSAARSRLQARLKRRGVAVGVGLSLAQMLGDPLGAADRSSFQDLMTDTVRAVLAGTAGSGTGAVSPAVEELARGITMLTTTKLRLVATVAIVLGLLGGAGTGIFFSAAADPAQPKSPKDPPSTTVKPEGRLTADPASGQDRGTAALDKPFGIKVNGVIAMNELLEQIEDLTDLVVRVDLAAFRRIGVVDNDEQTPFLQSVNDTKVILPRRADKMSVRDVITDALAQVRISHPCTYQIRGSQILIVPAYVPPVRPGVNPLELDPNGEDTPILQARTFQEQIYGPVVSVTVDHKPLAEILADLRKQTGSNIVIDPRCELAEKKVTVTVALSDVRLYDALRVIADMAELKMVYAGNVYYVTTAANAKSFQPSPPAKAITPIAPMSGLGGSK